MKKEIGILLALAVALAGVARCSAADDSSETPTVDSLSSEVAAESGRVVEDTATGEAVSSVSNEITVGTAVSDVPAYTVSTTITLGEMVSVDGQGADVDGGNVLISAGGAYRVVGALDDGQIRVDAGDENVILVLDGVDITCSTSAAIYVQSAKNAYLVLAEGSANSIADGGPYVYEDKDANEPNAALFSKSDLIITGSGSLTIEGNYKHTINCKDDLEISGTTIVATSAADGIRGKDSILIADADIMVTAGEDGLKSDNAEDPERGYVVIDGGNLDIRAGWDGIDAETRVIVQSGAITISSGGGSANSSSVVMGSGTDWRAPGTGQVVESTDTVSAKGIKGGVDVSIEDGVIDIDSADDSIHSNGTMTINGGSITISSGDDGMHADASLAINAGIVSITRSYEGIESAVIIVSGGDIQVIASDDGINVAGGGDGSAMGGRPGQNSFDLSDDQYLEITGGYIVVRALGDGLDANGAIRMSDGTVIIHGPTMSGNGALDYNGGFQMTGGLLIAVGSSGMAQAPDTSSTQYAVMTNFDSVQAAGTLVHIETDDGEEILTFAPDKEYQSVVLSSPTLQNGGVYTVYTGGSTTGSAVDGLYEGGEYTPGTQEVSLTITDIVTTWGSVGFGSGMGRPQRQ